MTSDDKYIKEFRELQFKYLEAAVQGPGLDEAFDNLFDWLRTTLKAVREEERERIKALLPEDVQDADLSPGFNITAEYRLGEIRGRNDALAEIRALLDRPTS